MRNNFINIMHREPITAATAIGMGIQAAAGAGQIYAQGKMNKKTREWNEKMYAIQRRDALSDRDYNSTEQQVERLKAAGLNPALLYGQTGATGVTQTRGSSPGSWNPEVPNISGMGIAGAQSMAQLELLKAQKANIEADTKNKLGDAANKPLVGANLEASTASLTQGVENQKAQEELTKAQTTLTKTAAEIAETTKWTAMGMIQKEMEKISNEVDLLVRQKHITAETQETVIANAKAQLAGAYILNNLNKEKIKLTTQEIQNLKNDIVTKWAEISQRGTEIGIKQFEANIHAFDTEMKANYPGLWNVIGKQAMDGMYDLRELFGMKQPKVQEAPKK